MVDFILDFVSDLIFEHPLNIFPILCVFLYFFILDQANRKKPPQEGEPIPEETDDNWYEPELEEEVAREQKPAPKTYQDQQRVHTDDETLVHDKGRIHTDNETLVHDKGRIHTDNENLVHDKGRVYHDAKSDYSYDEDAYSQQVEAEQKERLARNQQAERKNRLSLNNKKLAHAFVMSEILGKPKALRMK